MNRDARLQRDVLAELLWESAVNAAHIGVEVEDGIVTLAGRVDTYAEKWAAEKAALRVDGVKAVAVELEVCLPALSLHRDADIARSIENGLRWMSVLPHDALKVMLEKGWVTLSGTLHWDYQRRAALSLVRYISGVTGVSDHIAITPPVNMRVVREDIEAALQRVAGIDASGIEVSVEGAEVTLTGCVHDWTERQAVRDSVWNSPGVQSVVDNLTMHTEESVV